MIHTNHLWVLGASGYVGGALTRSLLFNKLPNEVITTLGHRNFSFEKLEKTNLLVGRLEQFDFSWLHIFPPSVVFHCARLAGNTTAKRGKASQKGLRANNDWITSLEKLESPPIVVYCSGTLMYGNQDAPTDEDTQLNPIAYARQYVQAEKPWVDYQGVKLDVRVARPAWIIGPDSWFLHFFVKPALQYGFVPFYGDGSQRMSLLHVEDCGGLLQHIYRNGSRNENYNLFIFDPITQKHFSEVVAKYLELPTRQISEGEVVNKYGKTVWEALSSDIPVTTKHKDWLESYTPQYADLEDMICAVVNDIRSNFRL